MSNYSYIAKREIPYDSSGVVKVDLSLAKNGISGIDVDSNDIISIVNLDIPIRKTDDRFDYDNYGTLLEYATDQSKLNISDLNIKVQLYYNYDFFSPIKPLETYVVAFKNPTQTELKLESGFVSDYIKTKHYLYRKQWKQKTIFDIKQLATDSKFVYSSNNVPVFSIIESKELGTYGKPVIYSNLNDILKLSSINLKLTGQPYTNFVFRFFDMFRTGTPKNPDAGNVRFLNFIESETYGSRSIPKTPFDFSCEIDYISYLLENKYLTNNSFFTNDINYFNDNDVVYYIGKNELIIKGNARYFVSVEFYENMIARSKWWRQSGGRLLWDVTVRTIGGERLRPSSIDVMNKIMFTRSTITNLFPRTNLIELQLKLTGNIKVRFSSGVKDSLNGFFFGLIRKVGDKQFHLKTIPEQINILKNGVLSPGYFDFVDKTTSPIVKSQTVFSQIQGVLKSLYREKSSIPTNGIKMDLQDSMLKFPWMTYVNISKSNPSIENNSSQYFIYNPLAEDTYVTSANKHFTIAGNVYVHDLDAKTSIDGVDYVQITRQNPVKFKPVSSRRVTNLDSRILTYSSAPIKAVIKNSGGYAKYYNLLIHIKNTGNVVITRNMSLAPSYKIIANNNSGSKNPSHFNITTTEFQDFFKKYPNTSYKYIVNINTVSFPSLFSKMKDGNDVDMIHLIAFGLTDAKRIRFNDQDQQHLGFINLSESENWRNQKLLDSRYVVTLGYEDDNTTRNLHRSTAFETSAWKDLTNFSIQLVDSNGDIIIFNGTKNYYPSFDISIFAVPITSSNKRRRIT